MVILAWLTSAPIRGRSSAARAPSPRRSALSEPLRPRYRTRTASTASALSQAATSASAVRSSSASSARNLRAGRGGLGPRHARELREGRRIVERERGQDLAVDLDSGLLEARDHPAVREAVLACGGTDPYDPERARVALLLLAVAVGVREALLERLARLAIRLAAASDEALGLLHRLLVTAACLRAAFGAWHLDYSSGIRGSAVGQQALDRLLVGGIDDRGPAEPALLLARLAGQLVSQVALPALHLAGWRDLEALGGPASRLELGHVWFPLFSVYSFTSRPAWRPASSTSSVPRAGAADRWLPRPRPSLQSCRAWRGRARDG